VLYLFTLLYYIVIVELKGVKHNYEVQLKGSGRTPYSRFGDGLAVLRSSVREYLCSEAMHYLNIPTTRALCLIGSYAKKARREKIEPTAIVSRVCKSHIRFGSFEHFHYRKQYEQVKQLADFTIQQYYPHLLSTSSSSSSDNSDIYLSFYKQVIQGTAELVA